MTLDKLKESARRFELREEWRKAIDTYFRAADELAEAGGPVDPALYNRIGDLELKAGDSTAALEAYERAADLYAEQGFFNNAIALCGKILRVAPGRTAVHLRLAELHARKNVVPEARRHAAQYLERMQRAGEGADAVRSLKRFAVRFAASQELLTAMSGLLAGADAVEEGELSELVESGEAGGPPRSGRHESAARPAHGASHGQGLVFIDTGIELPGFVADQVPDREAPISLEAASVELPPDDLLPDVEPTVLDLGDEPVLEEVLDGFEPTMLVAEPGQPVPVEPLVAPDEIIPILIPGLEPTVEPGPRMAPAAEAMFDELELDLDALAGPAGAGAGAGERARIRALEGELRVLEAAERWQDAAGVAAELGRLDPDEMSRQQKRVELAFLAGDRHLLVTAYLSLADLLMRTGAQDNAVLVYQRVLEHDATNPVATAAVSALRPRFPRDHRASERPEPDPEPEAESAPADGFVDLGALILEPEPDRDTRMRVEQGEPVGDEDQDFLETLAQFKEGIAANVSATDYDTHYDLGIAFKEMGLLDEAIAQFQKALRAPGGHLRSAEALGMTFLEKGRAAVAEAVLTRAIENFSGGESEKIGLLYWTGRAVEAQARTGDAVRWYERAVAVDITFHDVSDRLQRLTAENPS